MIETLSGKTYCNCLAQQRGLNPVGHGGSFDTALVIEAQLPWKLDMTRKAGTLSQPVIDLLDLWLQRYYAGEGYPHLLMVVAPDSEYAQEPYRRVMYFTRPSGLFSRFDKVEYLVPQDQVGALVWSLYEDRDALPQFEAYRVASIDLIRDILICTHGTVDAACAKFGFPLYKHMRESYADESLRVWRVSHFGGHVFAPTLMDMPSGHYWAYVGNAQAEQIIRRTGDVSNLSRYYRGWAGLESGFLQTLEAELWQEQGWQWFDYPKSGEIIQQSDDEQQAEICLHYRKADDATVYAVSAQLSISHKIETPHTTGVDDNYVYFQYFVTGKEEITS